jgi:precorrin-4/cobalt-precorrin-4 C11-methyltransferase
VSGGKVFLVGGGPGGADLITVRGARAIAASDIVVWGRPLVTSDLIREHARGDAEVIVWPPATMADIEAAYDRAAAEGLTVARLHGGDPAVYARLGEELARVEARGLRVEVIPGVTAACAAAAAHGWELSCEADRRPLVLACARGPDGGISADLVRVAAEGDALALYMTGSDATALERALLDAGYPSDTPCAIGHAVSWPEEALDRCPLSDLGTHLAARERAGQTVVLVGRARQR